MQNKFRNVVPLFQVCKKLPKDSFKDSILVYIKQEDKEILLPRIKAPEGVPLYPAPLSDEIITSLTMEGYNLVINTSYRDEYNLFTVIADTDKVAQDYTMVDALIKLWNKLHS